MTHYYSEKQFSEFDLKKIPINLKKVQFELFSASGIFSKDKLDKGSELLIENAIIEPNWQVLDFGCGIGVVGVSLKKLYPSINVTMLDINERAVMVSKKNVKLHNLDIKIIKSNLYSKINSKFDTILVNPPQTAGKELCFKIIEQAKDHLNSNGLLQLVARHNKGGSSLKKKMQELYGNVQETAKGSGYRVYVSKHRPIKTK